STFQHPFYPDTPFEENGTRIINVPLKAGSTGGDFKEAVLDHWLPALNNFKPELVIVSAGFDAHLEDDMAGLRFVERDYAWVTVRLLEVAETHAAGRLVSVLEGGYVFGALGRSAEAHVRALMHL
ncbi:MAG: histone deacetylase family protein, partial [Deltaproteobacteria bacterium]|nr:histone deacetylase family protein [Deltaproteobacteria bacterium]